MGDFKNKQWDMKVRSITKTDREKEDLEQTKYKMVARDYEGVNELTITSASPFVGISPRDGVIQVVLKQSQKSLSDFEKKKE